LGYPGVYGGSWTWFDAFIIRDADKSESEVISGLRFTRSRREHVQFVAQNTASGTGEEVQAWEIQRNVRAFGGRSVMHKVTWTLENGDALWESDWDRQPSAADVGRWDMKGHGGGVGFLSSLRNDDRIAIVANARVSLQSLLL